MSMYTAFNRSIEEGRTVERTTTSSVSMEIARGEALATRIKALEQKAEATLVLSHRIAVWRQGSLPLRSSPPADGAMITSFV